MTDHGSQFTSKPLASPQVTIFYFSVRHSQSNPVKRSMRNLSRLFRSYCSEKHSRWALEMHKFAGFFNLVVHESTGYYAVELQAENLTSIPSVVRKKIPYPEDPGQVPYERKHILAKKTLSSRTERRKSCNPGRPYPAYQPGELVFLKANPSSSVLTAETKKMTLHFEGPYKIKKQMGQATFILIDPRSERERSSFHVSFQILL